MARSDLEALTTIADNAAWGTVGRAAFATLLERYDNPPAAGTAPTTVVSNGSQASLQAALNAGGTIDVVGTYNLTSTLTVDVERTWVRFLNGAKLRWLGVTGTTPLMQVRTAAIRIDNIECEGSGTKGNGIGVQIGGHSSAWNSGAQPHGVHIINPRMSDLDAGVEFGIQSDGSASTGDCYVWQGRIKRCKAGVRNVGFVNWVIGNFASECDICFHSTATRSSARLNIVDCTGNQYASAAVAIDGGRGSAIMGDFWSERTDGALTPTEMIRIGSAGTTARNVRIENAHLHPMDSGTIEQYVVRLVNARGFHAQHIEVTDELPTVALVRVDATTTSSESNVIERLSIGDDAPAGWNPATMILSNASTATRPVIIKAVPNIAGSSGGSVLRGTPNTAADFTVQRDGTANTYFATHRSGHVQIVGTDTATTSGLRAVLAAIDGPNRQIHFTAGRFHFLDMPNGNETGAGTEDHYTWGSSSEPSCSGLTISGAGMTATILSNRTNWPSGADTEPLSFTNAQRVTIRDLTVESCGVEKLSTDAIDFDQGADCLVERVRITRSRGRAIVVDGGDTGRHADGTRLIGVIVQGRPPRPMLLPSTGGSLTTGTTYRYAVSWVDMDLAGANVSGETKVSKVASGTGSTAYRVQLPIGPYSTTARKVYRAPAGSTAWVLLTTVSDNTTTTYTDTGSAGSGVTMPVSTLSTIRGAALEILGSDLNEIRDCRIDGGASYGINIVRKGSGSTLSTADENLVTDNIIEGCNSNGLRVYGGSDNILDGNRIVDVGTFASKVASIRLDGTTGQESSRNLVRGNTLRDTQDANSPSAGVTTNASYQTTASTASNRFLDNLATGGGATSSIALGTSNTERTV